MTPAIVVLAIALITIIWLRREKQRESIAVGLIYLVVFALIAYTLSELRHLRLLESLSWQP